MDIQKTKRLLIIQEGTRNFVYDDVTGLNVHGSPGKLTIAHGRNLEDRGIDATEADLMLSNDIKYWVMGLTNNLSWYNDLDDVRQAVLVSLTHNLGMHGILEFKGMLDAMEHKNYALAADELLNSKAATNPALSRRYHDLAKMLQTGEWMFV